MGVKDKLNGSAGSVSGVQVIDDYTLQITIDAPKAYFLTKLAYVVAFVVDKNNVEQGGGAWTDKPNGTGPFKLKEYVHGQRIVLSRNENYYLDPKPQVDTAYFILGSGSPVTMYQDGDLDAAPVDVGDFESVSDPANPLNKEFSSQPTLTTNFIVFNTRKPPFDDPKVRQAFALAIDRQKVLDVVYRKMLPLANSILPPGMPGYVEPQTTIPYDVPRAKQLLAESKYGAQLPPITWLSVAQEALTMTPMLKNNLGVDVSIQQTDLANYWKLLNDPERPYQIFAFAWIADYADPQNFLEILFHSGSNQNWSNYSNAAVDQLLDQAGLEKDTVRRFKLYQQAEQMILADFPIVPLAYGQDYWLTKPYVKGMLYPPLVIPKLKYVSIIK